MPDKSNNSFQFWQELKRRKVIRVISQHMFIKIHGGKGKKDRYVQLTDGTLKVLRQFQTFVNYNFKDGIYFSSSPIITAN